MPTQRFLSNYNSGGYTDENGHFRLPLKILDGQVFEGFEVTAKSTPSMKVDVSKGEAKVPYSDYSYAIWSTGTEELTISTANSSNPRIDRIVAYVNRSSSYTTNDVNNPNAWSFAVVAGSPSANPVAAQDTAVSSAVNSNPWIEIARVNVATGATTITNNDIDNSFKVKTSLSGNVSVPNFTLSDGSKTKIVVINEGDALPPAESGTTLIVLVAKS